MNIKIMLVHHNAHNSSAVEIKTREVRGLHFLGTV